MEKKGSSKLIAAFLLLFSLGISTVSYLNAVEPIEIPESEFGAGPSEDEGFSEGGVAGEPEDEIDESSKASQDEVNIQTDPDVPEVNPANDPSDPAGTGDHGGGDDTGAGKAGSGEPLDAPSVAEDDLHNQQSDAVAGEVDEVVDNPPSEDAQERMNSRNQDVADPPSETAGEDSGGSDPEKEETPKEKAAREKAEKEQRISDRKEGMSAKSKAEGAIEDIQSEMHSDQQDIAEKKAKVRQGTATEEDVADLEAKQKKMEANKEKLSQAKEDLEAAQQKINDSYSGDKGAQVEEQKEVVNSAKEELQTAKDDLATEQEKLDEMKKEGSKSTEEEVAAQEKVVEEKQAAVEEKEQALKEAKSELSDKKFDYYKDKAIETVKEKIGCTGVGDCAFKAVKFAAEQFIMSVLFSLAPEMFQALTQSAQNKKLYKDITAQQTFAGIKLQIPDGFVPANNPTGGFFMYYDVQPGATINDTYLKDPSRRWFVSYDPNSSYNGGNVAKTYIGSAAFPNVLLELSTGFIFDDSGFAYNAASPSLRLLKVTNKSNHPLIPPSDPNKLPIVQEIISTIISSRAKGETDTDSVANISVVELMKNGGSKAAGTKAKGNPAVAAQFDGGGNAPVLKDTLHTYATPARLAGFGNLGDLAISSLQGIGTIAQLFGDTFIKLYHPNLTVSEKNTIIKTGTLPGQESNQQVINYADGQKNLKSLASAKDKSKVKIVGFGVSDKTVGFDATSHAVGLGIYVYQTDSTPTAKMLKKFVSSGANKELSNYVHDIVVALDVSKSIVPALVPIIVGGKIVFKANPSAVYVSSLVSHLTYEIHNGYNPVSTLSATGSVSIDLSIAKDYALKAVAKFETEGMLLQQINQVADLFKDAVEEGPFHLNNGLLAERVNLSEMFNSKTAMSETQQETAQELANVAKGQKAGANVNVDPQTQLISAMGSFVYSVNGALRGLDGEGNEVHLPDYVVPVTIDTNGRYLVVPLGLGQITKNGLAIPSQTSLVTALVSLVTGQMFDHAYKPLDPSMTTTIGDVTVPLSNAFMESEFNPANDARPEAEQTKVVKPCYFMFSKSFDFCPATIVSPSLETVFACDKPKSLSGTFAQLFPQAFTGMDDTGQVTEKSTDSKGKPIDTSRVKTVKPSGPLSKGTILGVPFGVTPSIADVHGSWKAYMEKHLLSQAQKDGSKLPSIFRAQPIGGGYYITPTSPQDVIHQNHFYTITNEPGVYVMAQYAGTATSMLTGPATTTLKDFSNIGASYEDIYDKDKPNVFIHIGTGQVFVLETVTDSKGNKSIKLNLMARYANDKKTYLETIRLNANEVIQEAEKLSLDKKLTPSLQAQVSVLQGNETPTDFLGPYTFGPLTFVINRDDYNNGRYIYQVMGADGKTATDYLVTFDDASYIFGKPFKDETPAMVSLISSKKYSGSGSKNLSSDSASADHFGGNTLAGKDPHNSFYQKILFNIGSYSGTTLTKGDTSTTGAVSYQAIATLADSNAPSAEDVKPIVTTSLEDRAMTQAKVYLPKTKFTALNGLKELSDQQKEWENVVKDADGSYFLRASVGVEKDATGKVTSCNDYYAFNIVTSTNSILIFKDGEPVGPIGAHYSLDDAGNVQVTNVYTGEAALSMLDAHRLSYDEKTKAISLGMPVASAPLPMSSKDQTLASGKDGDYMKLIPHVKPVRSGTLAYYFYENIFHTGAPAPGQTVTVNTPTEKAKQDITEYLGFGKFSPYDILSMVCSIDKDKTMTPLYYISLMTGKMYQPNGKALPEKTSLLFKNIAKGLAQNVPLVTWGQTNTLSAMVFDADENAFYQAIIRDFGPSFQYADLNKKLHTYTYNPVGLKDSSKTYPVNGQVYEVVDGQVVATSGTDVTTIAGAGATFKQLKAQRNMRDAIAAASNAKQIPVMTVYNMSYTTKAGLKLVTLQENNSGNIKLFSTSKKVNPKGDQYQTIFSNQFVAHMMTYVGSRPSGDTSVVPKARILKDEDGHVVPGKLNYSRLVLLKDMRQGANTLSAVIRDDGYYSLKKKSSGTGSVNENVYVYNFSDGTGKQDAMDTFSVTMASYNELFGGGSSSGKASSSTSSKPSNIPSLAQFANDGEYISIVQDGTEDIYQYEYPTPLPDAIEALKGVLGVTLASSSHGYITLLDGVPDTNLKKVTLNANGSDTVVNVTDNIKAMYQDAQMKINNAQSKGGQFYNSAQTDFAPNPNQNNADASKLLDQSLNRAITTQKAVAYGGYYNSYSDSSKAIKKMFDGAALTTYATTLIDLDFNLQHSVFENLQRDVTNGRLYLHITGSDTTASSSGSGSSSDDSSLSISLLEDGSAPIDSYVQIPIEGEEAGYIFQSKDKGVTIPGVTGAVKGLVPTGAAVTSNDLASIMRIMGQIDFGKSATSGTTTMNMHFNYAPFVPAGVDASKYVQPVVPMQNDYYSDLAAKKQSTSGTSN